MSLPTFPLRGPSFYDGIIKFVKTENIAEERDLSAQDDVLGDGYTVVTKTKLLNLQRLYSS